ncbi:hypothetical protein FALB51S_03282 [Frigidibacter albus]
MRLVLAAAFALLAAIPARAEDIHIPLNSDFSSFALDWNTRNESSTVYWTTIEHGGKLAICGLIQHHDATLMQYDSKILRRSTIKVNGKVVLKGLQFFTTIGNGGKPEKSQATCRVLEGPLPPKDAQFLLTTPALREYS